MAMVEVLVSNGHEMYREGLDLAQIQTDYNLTHFAESDLIWK